LQWGGRRQGADPFVVIGVNRGANIFRSGKIETDRATIAKEAIKSQQADLMYLFPVYEEKLKEGVLVRKYVWLQRWEDSPSCWRHLLCYSKS